MFIDEPAIAQQRLHAAPAHGVTRGSRCEKVIDGASVVGGHRIRRVE